jgi:hypothetical protein
MAGHFVNSLSRKPKPGYPDAVARLKAEARALLHLPGDVVVAVTELACREPGCPDIETVVAVLKAGEKPRTARIHKPIPAVTAEDLAAGFTGVADAQARAGAEPS